MSKLIVIGLIFLSSFLIKTEVREYFVTLTYKVNGKVLSQELVEKTYSIYIKEKRVENMQNLINLYDIDSINVNYNDTTIHVDFDFFLPFVVNNHPSVSMSEFDIDFITLDKIETKDSFQYCKTLHLGNGSISDCYGE